MTPDQVLLTTGAASARLGVSPNTLRRWVEDRRISFVRLPSGQLRFRPQDIDAALTVQQPVTADAGSAA